MNILPAQPASEKPFIVPTGWPGAAKLAGRFAAAILFGLTMDK
jgi:hypothetical protein